MIRYLISIAILGDVVLSKTVKQYRSDYAYNPDTDAFYKLHTDPAEYKIAKETCEAESAKLIMTVPRDIIQAHGMLKQYPDIGDKIWAGDDGLPHDSGEDNKDVYRQCEVIMRDGEVDKISCYFNSFPFICKEDAKYAYYDLQCQVFSRDYQYVESVGSCYKISSAAITWNQAYAECQAEGAHLVVLNSEQEHQAVFNLTHFAPKISDNAYSPWYWFAGTRANRPKDGSPLVFKTIFGQTLQEAGYDQWSPGEPNNATGDELCGSIFTNDGKYNDLKCSHRFAFICEKEINAKT